MSQPKHAEKLADLVAPEVRAGMSGLKFMRQILDGHSPHPPIAQLMNFRLAEVEDGTVTFTGRPEFAAANPMGTTHGGWYGTLLDSAMACSVMTKIPSGSDYTTLEYKVNLIRSIPIGQVIIAVGQVIHSGRSTAVAEGKISDSDGRVYATGTTTCMIYRNRSQ